MLNKKSYGGNVKINKLMIVEMKYVKVNGAKVR